MEAIQKSVIVDGYLFKRRYIGYTDKQATRQFIKDVKSQLTKEAKQLK